jgi:uncharacterized protein (DUF1501 family)
MEKKSFHIPTRREFIRKSCLAVGTISIAQTIRDLRLINSAAAQEIYAPNDYKALVCVFLGGGNDANNLIIPRSGNDYSNYATIRQNLALPASSLLPINPINSDGREYGFHPSCARLQELFDEGKLATLFNVGPLVYPMTRAQYSSNSVARPPQLFSHSDQVTHWQTSLPDQPPRTGWGGRVADLLHPGQLDLLSSGLPGNNAAKIALCTSIAGNNTFEVGGTYQQYHVGTGGAVTMSNVSGDRLQAVKDILSIPSNVVSNLQRQAYSDIIDGALATGDLLNTAIANTNPVNFPNYWTTSFPGGSLSDQLRMVARIIEGRGSNELNMRRQIFYVTDGGYDTHTSQVQNNGNNESDRLLGEHATRLNRVSESLYAFQRAMVQLGLDEKVTAFTASDFGRTFRTNGQGSDHGWGSHHIIVGGAVRGKRIFGTFPSLQLNGPDAVPTSSEGRWIPTTSVDQYSATLASWFGVSNTNMSTVFPNIGRFGDLENFMV